MEMKVESSEEKWYSGTDEVVVAVGLCVHEM
jgi:hypothetical protein